MVTTDWTGGPLLIHCALVLVALCCSTNYSQACEHPRFFFSSDDIPRLRAQAQTTHREIWQSILEAAQSSVDASPAATAPDRPNLDKYRTAANELLPFAFAYVITGDQRYFELTRRHLLTYAQWTHWGDEGEVGGHDLGFHHMLMFNAIAYDWLYNDLSREDRKTIGSNLAKRADESYQVSLRKADPDSTWWTHSWAQNHCWINHSALGVAALVLAGEDARTQSWLDDSVYYLTRVRYLLEGIADGSWHEGLPYQSYGLTMSLVFLQNLRRLTGQDLIPHAYYRNYAYSRLYNFLPHSDKFALSYAGFDWSWGSTSYHPPQLLRFVAKEYRDGHAEWAAEQYLASIGRSSHIWSVPWQVLEFLNYDPTVSAESPNTLPLTRTFPDLAGVIWRTGWGDGDLTFALKTGAYGGHFAFERWFNVEYPFDHPEVDQLNAAHDHGDMNTFYLYRGGVDLTSETVSYRDNKAAGHNTLVVDGEGQWNGLDDWGRDRAPFKGTEGRLEAVCEAKDFDYLVADATDLYRPYQADGVRPGDRKLTEFKRHVLFVAPGYLVMLDRVRADAPHRYDWACHFTQSVAVDGDWIKGMAERDQMLGVKVVAPAGFGADMGEDGKPYVRVHPAGEVANTEFVMVLYPTDAANWEKRPEISSLGASEEVCGVRVRLDGVQDHLINCGDEKTVVMAGYSFDGKAASIVSDAGGHLKRVFLAGGSRLADRDGLRLLFQGRQQDIVVEAVYEGTALALYGRDLDGLAVYAPGIDASRVTVNGRAATVTREGDYFRLG